MRRFVTREKDHRRDVNSLKEVKFTSSGKKDSLTEVHPSALMDYVAQTNYTSDWDSVKLPMKEEAWII